MKTEKPLNVVLKDMTLVHKLAKNSGLKSGKLKGSDTAATRLAKYLGVTKTQAYLISTTFFLNLKNSLVDIMDVGKHFEMDEDDMVCLIPEFNELVSKKFLQYTHRRYREDESLLNRNVKVAQPLCVCIFANEPVSEMEQEPPMDIFRFVHEVSNLIESRSSFEFPTLIPNLASNCISSKIA